MNRCWKQSYLVSVPDPKPTPAQIAFSIPCVILEAIYAPDEVWDETKSYQVETGDD